MNQHEYVAGVLQYYRENDIIPGDPNEGPWEKAHYPLPKGMGDEVILLKPEHHIIQGFFQSLEVGRCCFRASDGVKLYSENYWTPDWFNLCERLEEILKDHFIRCGKATPEIVAKRNLANRGQKRSEETKRKMSLKKLGVPKSEAFKENLRVKMSGEGNPFYGKKHNQESLEKMSAWQKDLPLLVCPHCGFETKSRGMMSRWHNDNCKVHKLTPKVQSNCN